MMLLAVAVRTAGGTKTRWKMIKKAVLVQSWLVDQNDMSSLWVFLKISRPKKSIIFQLRSNKRCSQNIQDRDDAFQISEISGKI